MIIDTLFTCVPLLFIIISSSFFSYVADQSGSLAQDRILISSPSSSSIRDRPDQYAAFFRTTKVLLFFPISIKCSVKLQIDIDRLSRAPHSKSFLLSLSTRAAAEWVPHRASRVSWLSLHCIIDCSVRLIRVCVHRSIMIWHFFYSFSFLFSSDNFFFLLFLLFFSSIMKNDTPLEALISYSLTKKKFIYSGKSLEVESFVVGCCSALRRLASMWSERLANA